MNVNLQSPSPINLMQFCWVAHGPTALSAPDLQCGTSVSNWWHRIDSPSVTCTLTGGVLRPMRGELSLAAKQALCIFARPGISCDC